MKFRLLVFLLMFIFITCNSQPKTYGESPLILDKFNFVLDISKFYPEKYRDKNSAGNYYDIPINNSLGRESSQLIEKYTLSIDGEKYNDIRFNSDEKAKWIIYEKKSYSILDTVATYNKFAFNGLNTLTTLNGEVILLNSLFYKIDEKSSNEFIALLDSQYGKNVKTQGKFIKEYDIYTWETKDKIYKYCPVYKDMKNSLVINEGEGKIDPYYNGYFFIIKKKFAKELIGKFRRGDFLYCN